MGIKKGIKKEIILNLNKNIKKLFKLFWIMKFYFS